MIIGLCNLGSTCYMNSCIQILLHIKVFVVSLFNNIKDNNRLVTKSLYEISYKVNIFNLLI